MSLTMGEYLMALRLRKDGKNWVSAAREIGKTVEKVRGALDPEWLEHRRLATRRHRDIKAGRIPRTKPPLRDAHRPIHCPDEVLQERERAYSDYRSIFGDPPLGRSALEKRHMNW